MRPALLLLALLAGCSGRPSKPTGAAAPFDEAEALMRSDPRWIGADAALSIPLGGDRTLWLFGDTFVAKTAKNVRTESEMVRNTIAIQTGLDPLTAKITFHWRDDPDGTPASFFPERGDRWHWPGHGIRLEGGPLLVWMFVLRATPNEGLGFADDGWRLVVIDNPDAPPPDWKLQWFDGPAAGFDATPATAVLRDGDDVVALAIRQQGVHAGYLVRWPIADLLRGELGGARWKPEPVIDDAGAENSLHFDGKRYVLVASYGFGASTIGVRTAKALTGPWSEPAMLYTPPESSGPKPFVYAAKAHPELSAGGDLVITYATNSFDFGDLFTEQGAQKIYWPRFVRMRLDP